MIEHAKNAWIKPREFSLEWGGRTLTIATGVVAQQASGSALVQYGDTVVLVTATMSKEVRGDIDYFPLMVDYEERLYAAGIIKGSRFIKRETRPTTEAVLTARLVDRAIRPLFDDSVRLDVQVVVTVLSVDGENDPDLPALIGATSALLSSDIPWGGPIAGARVGRIDDQWVINPTYEENTKSELEILVAGDGKSTIMLEAGAKEVSEDVIYDAIQFAHKHISPVMKLLKKIEAELGEEKRDVQLEMTEEEKQAQAEIKELRSFVKELVEKEIDIFFEPGKNITKQLRKGSLAEMKEKIEEAFTYQ